MRSRTIIAATSLILASAVVLFGATSALAAKHARPHRTHHPTHHRAKHRRSTHHAKPSGRPHPQPVGPLITPDGQQPPTHGGSATSLNWSGYAVTPGSGVTGVSSTFVVPKAGLVPPGFAASWAGIGGYNTSDLIQAGVAEQSLPSNPLLGPQYYPWYELLPDDSVQLINCSGDANCTVNPGDTVNVQISENSPGSWKISMSDSGHWSWQSNFTYASSGSSAEWILEAPTVITQTLLAPVGTVPFSASQYTTSSGAHTIAAGSPTAITLSPLPISGLLDEATPSALSNGQAFNVCAYKPSCPAP